MSLTINGCDLAEFIEFRDAFFTGYEKLTGEKLCEIDQEQYGVYTMHSSEIFFIYYPDEDGIEHKYIVASRNGFDRMLNSIIEDDVKKTCDSLNAEQRKAFDWNFYYDAYLKMHTREEIINAKSEIIYFNEFIMCEVDNDEQSDW